jgi:hypothetical protein
MMHSVNMLLLGASALASAIIGLFFLRFWKSSKDRFFLFFAAAFFIESANKVFLQVVVGLDEDAPVYFLIRLLAYGLILAAILDKNLGDRGTGRKRGGD